MLDPKFIRNNTDVVKKALEDRKDPFDLGAFMSLDRKRRELLSEIEALYAVQNKIDQEVQKLLRESKSPQERIDEGKKVKKKIAELDGNFDVLDVEWKEKLDHIPNVPHSSIPRGDISCNKTVRKWGEQKKFDFNPLAHVELAENLDIIDFRGAAKITGSNFVLFKKKGAQLERALFNFMLDLHTQKHGYTEVFPPFLVNKASMRGTGQLPKLEEDMYKLEDDDLFLIPTAEVPVTNIHRDDVLDEKDLPLYYTAYTACFRREAGSYGKETRGLARVHQFDKVELVKFVKPQDSYRELEGLVENAGEVLKLLELPYRIAMLATADLSFAASKCYDFEAYAPGIDKWLEVSSCSNFEDFQARRSNIRYKDKRTGKKSFVHTLNGSGIALARTVVAILENYQNPDGTVAVPSVLRKYMNGCEVIKPE